MKFSRMFYGGLLALVLSAFAIMTPASASFERDLTYEVSALTSLDFSADLDVIEPCAEEQALLDEHSMREHRSPFAREVIANVTMDASRFSLRTEDRSSLVFRF